MFACFSVQGQNYNDIINEFHQKLDSHLKKDKARVDLLNELSYAYHQYFR